MQPPKTDYVVLFVTLGAVLFGIGLGLQIFTMIVETAVTVTARVMGEVSSLATTVATSTPDVSWLQSVWEFISQLF